MSANDMQVGGSHYRSSQQHWDLAHDLDLGYFEGQISKYITRHRFKKGLEDAQKAQHFTKKLLELATHHGRQARHKWVTEMQLSDYCAANKLNGLEHLVLRKLFTWQTLKDLAALYAMIDELIQHEYGDGAGPGYVNQG